MDAHSHKDVPPPHGSTTAAGPAASSSSSGGRLGNGFGDAEEAPADHFKQAAAAFGEVREYAAYFLATKVDGVKVALRNVALYAVLGLLGAVAGGTIVVTASVLLLVGLANAIGKIFDPDQPWVGQLLVSLLVLGGLAGGAVVFLKKFTRTSRERMVQKYESRQRQQRVNFGHDVRERAAEATRTGQ